MSLIGGVYLDHVQGVSADRYACLVSLQRIASLLWKRGGLRGILTHTNGMTGLV